MQIWSWSRTTMADLGCSLMEKKENNAEAEPDHQRQMVKYLTDDAERDLREGNLYYVVSARWFSRWESFVGREERQTEPCDSGDGEVERPGPIDNSDIIQTGISSSEGEPELAMDLLEGRDYVLLPHQVWEKLFQWYKGGPVLPRRMISQGLPTKKQFNVELYPVRLKLIDSRDNTELIIRLSKKASVHELYEKVCTLREIDPQKALIWDYFNGHKHLRLVDNDKTLEQSHLQMDQQILLELQVDQSFSQLGKDSTGNELALVAFDPPRSSLSIAGGPTMSNGHSSSYSLNLLPGSSLNTTFTDINDSVGAYNSVRRGEKGGLAGLQNMGNTCFMNSALQCLVHTPPLVEYFLQDYLGEINTENPLGMKGELAIAFGELLRKLWSSGRTAFAPRAFKGKLALFAPQFSGYNQHDSQVSTS